MGAINRPDWPRMMKRGTAAAYCDLTPKQFELEVFAGRLPGPVMLGDEEHWSRIALDEKLADISGERRNDWRRHQKAYAA